MSRLTYTYDGQGRLASETQDLSPAVTGGVSDPLPRTVTYGYNEDGRRAGVTYPDETSLAYTYTPRGQLKEVSGDGAVIASYAYDAAGNRTLMPRENQTVTAQTFDALNRPVDIQEKTNGGSLLAESAYAYDAAGNRESTTRREPGTGVVTQDSYAYDETYQVAGADYQAPVSNGVIGAPQQRMAVSYDAVGNRTAYRWHNFAMRQQVSATYTTNALNQYTQAGALLPTWDATGNLSSYNSWHYAYDALNRLVRAWNDTMDARFYYVARNRCVARSYNGVATLNYYDSWNLIAEYNPTGGQLARYVHGAKIDEVILISNRQGVFYPHRDVLGNVDFLTNASGRVVERYTYSAEGKVTIFSPIGTNRSSSAVGNRWMFTGRERLAEVGLYDRIYSAGLGRFIQTDPIRLSASDVNLYRYVSNRYLSGSDPTGLDIIPINAPDAVLGFGHKGVIIGQPGDYVWYSYGSGNGISSSSGTGDNMTGGLPGDHYSTVEAAMAAANVGRSDPYTNSFTITTTPAQDAAAIASAESWRNTAYNAFTHNCVQMVNAAVNAAGIATTGSWVPNSWQSTNGGGGGSDWDDDYCDTYSDWCYGLYDSGFISFGAYDLIDDDGPTSSVVIGPLIYLVSWYE